MSCYGGGKDAPKWWESSPEQELSYFEVQSYWVSIKHAGAMKSMRDLIEVWNCLTRVLEFEMDTGHVTLRSSEQPFPFVLADHIWRQDSQCA